MSLPDFARSHAEVIWPLVDIAASLRQVVRASGREAPLNERKKLMRRRDALALLASLAALPAAAQQIEFDIYDKSDFDRQLASGKPVIVHVNTTW